MMACRSPRHLGPMFGTSSVYCDEKLLPRHDTAKLQQGTYVDIIYILFAYAIAIYICVTSINYTSH